MLNKRLHYIKNKNTSKFQNFISVYTTHCPFLVGAICSLQITASHSKILAPGFLSFSPTLLVSWCYYLHNCSNTFVSQFLIYHCIIHFWVRTLDLTIINHCESPPPHTHSPITSFHIFSFLLLMLSSNSSPLPGPTIHCFYLFMYLSTSHVLISHPTDHKVYSQILPSPLHTSSTPLPLHHNHIPLARPESFKITNLCLLCSCILTAKGG